MYSLRVDYIGKDNSQADNRDYLKVSVSIIETKNVPNPENPAEAQEVKEIVEQKNLGFPLDTPDDVLESELNKVLATFINDRDLAAKNAEHEKAQKKADETIAKFSGRQFSIELNERVGVHAENQQ